MLIFPRLHPRKQHTFGLTHRYSRLTDFVYYAVQTSLTLEELNQACAYLQFLRDGLPNLSGTQDSIGESDGIELLAKIYDCQPIISNETISIEGIIDFYDSWADYSGPDYRQVNKMARQRARVIIVQNLLQEVIGQYQQTQNDDSFCTIEILFAIVKGYDVPKDWNLKDCSGNPYFGKINLQAKVDLL